ncbi:MAG: NAD(P)-binding protein [Jatrophihabitans sp.]|uniref:NAD(P)-binding protein n=1 Tax=Jatrophihabitans sp. TaxID=1932789 RepID=UPI003F803DB4
MDTDYLVVGAGAMGMAFADAVVTHADVHVTLVDRRPAPGGHWLDAYPFVQLHQASQFYGVASRRLGTGAVQTSGPEAGLHERARRVEIEAYYDDVLHRVLLPSGRVTFLSEHEYGADGGEHVVRSLVSGRRQAVRVRHRVVDATYLAPRIPALVAPPFAVADDARVVPVNGLTALDAAPGRFVLVGAGKTASDAVVWLLRHGVDPDRLTWVRPRDPWMLNRAVIQPDPAVTAGFSADLLGAAAAATSVDELFLGLEAAGVMLRIDPTVLPTMARAPTLGTWELDLLRQVEHVVRLGHVRGASARELVLDRGTVPLDADTVVVHCAAEGLRNPGLQPIWQPDVIRLQTIRPGFPCFCAALAGVVEATRDDDRERNRLCAPNAYGDTPREWAAMQARGIATTARYMAEPDLAAWADDCLLTPAWQLLARRDEPAVAAQRARLAEVSGPGLDRLAALAGV